LRKPQLKRAFGVANVAAWKCEIVPEKYGRKALFTQFLADCEADWPTARPVELRVQLCNRFARRTRWWA
jgi:hypothetical protein